jgi:hypothetical protein
MIAAAHGLAACSVYPDTEKAADGDEPLAAPGEAHAPSTGFAPRCDTSIAKRSDISAAQARRGVVTSTVL